MKLKEWMDEWLEDIKLTTKIHTYYDYCAIVSNHILPFFGEKELAELNHKEIQRWVSSYLIEEKKYSTSTVKLSFVVLKNALKVACEEDYLEKNPCEKVKLPSPNKKEVRVFTKAEQKKLEEAVYESQDHRKLGFIISLYTGLRIGELLALKWENVDMKRRIIHVRSTVITLIKDGKQEIVYDSPKTKASLRDVPFGKNVLDILYLLKQDHSAFVVSERKQPIRVRSYEAMYKKFLQDNRLPDYKFHTLRHTFATRALELNIDIKTISELLGHETPSTTLNIYSHTLLETKISAMRRISTLFYK